MSLINLVSARQKYINGYVIKELSLAGKLNNNTLELYSLLMSGSDELYDLLDTLSTLKSLVLQKPLSPVDNPKITNEYLDHGNGTLQSTRLASLFSKDNGETWYDIDRTSRSIKFWRFVWNLMPGQYPDRINNYILDKILYYVQFPYEVQ